MEKYLVGKYVPIFKSEELQRGTIVKHRGSERVYVVTGNYGDRVTAVASVDITHLSEWQRFDDSASAEPK